MSHQEDMETSRKSRKRLGLVRHIWSDALTQEGRPREDDTSIRPKMEVKVNLDEEGEPLLHSCGSPEKSRLPQGLARNSIQLEDDAEERAGDERWTSRQGRSPGPSVY